MKNEKRVPGELINVATCEEILVSTGIQLATWAGDIAFTDAAYGEDWCIETADRMASLSHLLSLLYERLPSVAMGIRVELPEGMVGEVRINPNFDPGSASDDRSGQSKAAGKRRGKKSIDDFPF